MKSILRRKSNYVIMFFVVTGVIVLLYGIKKQYNSHLIQENQKIVYSIGDSKEKCLDISSEDKVIVYRNGYHSGCYIFTYDDIQKD